MSHQPHPLLVAVAVPRGDGIRFSLPHGHYDVPASQAPLVWAILGECTGHQPKGTVIAKARAARPQDRALVPTVLDDLEGLGFVVDAAHAYTHFHRASQNPRAYATAVSNDAEAEALRRSPHRLPMNGTPLALPPVDGELAKMLAARRSCRAFSDRPVSLDELGRVLANAHATPSAGGLRPLSCYVVMDEHVHVYDAARHELVRLRRVEPAERDHAMNSPFVPPVWIVITADVARVATKYGNRGYRFALLEAGHMAQNMLLTAAEAGLGTCDYGGYHDQALTELLGIPDLPLLAIAIGHLGSSPPPSPVGALRLEIRDRTGTLPRARLVNPPPVDDGLYRVVVEHRGAVGQGRGRTSYAAEIAAFGEAYERLASGQYRSDRTAPASALDEPWLDPRFTHPLTLAQYAKLPGLRPFDPNEPIDWVRGQRLSTGESVLIPADVVWYPHPPGHRPIIYGTSSGVAAYTDRAGAIRRGLAELIERHVIMERWLRHESPTRLAVSALPDRWQRQAASWRSLGWVIHVLATNEFGACVVEVFLVNTTGHPAFSCGAAASFDSFESALEAAFGEAAGQIPLVSKEAPRRRADNVWTPLDHQAFYAHPDQLVHLDWLWSGPETTKLPTPPTGEAHAAAATDPIAVTLDKGRAGLHVVRMLSEALIPIGFGTHHLHRSHPAVSRSGDQITPVPHYFP